MPTSEKRSVHTLSPATSAGAGVGSAGLGPSTYPDPCDGGDAFRASVSRRDWTARTSSRVGSRDVLPIPMHRLGDGAPCVPS